MHHADELEWPKMGTINEARAMNETVVKTAVILNMFSFFSLFPHLNWNVMR